MLIKIFGIWLVANNIAMLEPEGREGCTIYMVSGAGYGRPHIRWEYENRTCDEIANEINRQITK